MIQKHSAVPLEMEQTILTWFRQHRLGWVSKETKVIKLPSSVTTLFLNSKVYVGWSCGTAVPSVWRPFRCLFLKRFSKDISSWAICSGQTGWTVSQEWTFSLISTTPCTLLSTQISTQLCLLFSAMMHNMMMEFKTNLSEEPRRLYQSEKSKW